MRIFFRALIIFLFSLVLIQGSSASEDPWILLQKASQAAHELSYKGIFFYQSVNSSRSVQLMHMAYNRGEFSRMVVLDGRPREVLAQGDDVSIFNQKNEKVLIEKKRGQSMFPALLPTNLDSIRGSYQAQIIGNERIGGRDAQVIHLTPKDRFRYAFRFWVDREYGLLLKVAILDERGTPLEQTGFSQIGLLEGQNMDWFRPKLDPSKSYVMDEQGNTPVRSEGLDEGFITTDIPPGFRKVDQVKLQVQGKRLPAIQMIFSDGLSAVSIFIEPVDSSIKPKLGHSSLGATNFYGLVQDGHQVMVVGEVPEPAVNQFAVAINFKK
jgi:sigma-E factor negative regulatory protein RseB